MYFIAFCSGPIVFTHYLAVNMKHVTFQDTNQNIQIALLNIQTVVRSFMVYGYYNVIPPVLLLSHCSWGQSLLSIYYETHTHIHTPTGKGRKPNFSLITNCQRVYYLKKGRSFDFVTWYDEQCSKEQMASRLPMPEKCLAAHSLKPFILLTS